MSSCKTAYGEAHPLKAVWKAEMDVAQPEVVLDFKPTVSRKLNFESGFVAYLGVLLLFIGLALLSVVFESLIGYRAVGFLFLLGVLFVGSIGATGPVLFAALLSTLVWNFFFIPPRFTFAIAHSDDILLCITYFATALMTGFLTRKIRKSEAFSRTVENRTDRLYETLKQLSFSNFRPEEIERVLRNIEPIVNGSCAVLLKDASGNLPGAEQPLGFREWKANEFAVAELAFSTNQETDWPTIFATDGQVYALPMIASRETVGVFLMRPNKNLPLSEDQKVILASIARQIAFAIESTRCVTRTKPSLDVSRV